MHTDSPSLRRFQQDTAHKPPDTDLRESLAKQVAEFLAQGGCITQVGVQVGTKIIKRSRREQVDHIRRRTWNNGNKLFDTNP
jgi:hypothetical protein